MRHQRGLARIISNPSQDQVMSSSDSDHSNEINMYNLRQIIFGDTSTEEVQDLLPDKTWRLIETLAASGDRIVVSFSGDLKRERIGGATLPLYESSENSWLTASIYFLQILRKSLKWKSTGCIEVGLTMSNEAGTSKLLHLRGDNLGQESFLASLIQTEVAKDSSAKMKAAWWKRYRYPFQIS